MEEAWHPVGRERHPSFTRGKVRFEGPSNSEGPVCTIVLPHLGSCQILVRDRPTCCRHILELRKIVTLDQGPPGSSIHGTFQARVLVWGAIAFSPHLHRYSEIYLLGALFPGHDAPPSALPFQILPESFSSPSTSSEHPSLMR